MRRALALILLAAVACGGAPEAREYETAQAIADDMAGRGVPCFEVTHIGDEDPLALDAAACTLADGELIRLEVVDPDADIDEAVASLRKKDPKGQRGWILVGKGWVVFTGTKGAAGRIRGVLGGEIR